MEHVLTNGASQEANGTGVEDGKVKSLSVAGSSHKRCQSSEGEDIAIPTGSLKRRLYVVLLSCFGINISIGSGHHL